MTNTSPRERRLTAIGDLVDRFLVDWSTPKPGSYPAEVASYIRSDLLPLGRSESWRKFVVGWADALESFDTRYDRNDPKSVRHFSWLVVQNAIFASHRA